MVIAKYPVTNAEYSAYLRTLSSADSARHYCRLMEDHFFGGIMKDFSVKPGFEKKPVVFVSWYDAVAYAKWAGGRLPTAQEWLKAAAWLPEKNRLATYCTGSDEKPKQLRGKCEGCDGCEKCERGEGCERCEGRGGFNFAVFYDRVKGWALPAPHLADVDWYQPSGPNGLCGMAGNVGEWVDSETGTGWKRALGGSLFRPVEFCRTDAGEADHPSKRLSTFGFRICRD